MNRTPLLLPLILLSLTKVYAVDLSLTDQVIHSAIDATEGLQSSMENVVHSGEEMINMTNQDIPLETIIDPNVTIISDNTEAFPITAETLAQLPEATTIPLEGATYSQPQTVRETIASSSKPLVQVDSSLNEEDEEDDDEDEETPHIIEGSIDDGQKIFLTHIKPVCGVTGAEFAANYSQEEWEEIFDVGEFKKVLIQLCPKAEPIYNDEWEADLARFSHEYANDSDSISDC